MGLVGTGFGLYGGWTRAVDWTVWPRAVGRHWVEESLLVGSCALSAMGYILCSRIAGFLHATEHSIGVKVVYCLCPNRKAFAVKSKKKVFLILRGRIVNLLRDG